MKALINPLQENLVAQVTSNNSIFPVANPFYWVDCPDDIVAGWYYYDNGEFKPYVPPPPTAEDNKQTAVFLLQQTDWTSIADVGNPQLANPYLANQAAFIQWRSQVRAIAVTPVAGNLDIFTQMPPEVWQTI